MANELSMFKQSQERSLYFIYSLRTPADLLTHLIGVLMLEATC